MIKENKISLFLEDDEVENEHSEVYTIACETPYGKYFIATKKCVNTIDEFTETLLIPLLLSIGYQPDNINQLFYGLKDNERGK